MKCFFAISLFIVLGLNSKAQTSLENIEGVVSFTSSQNTYVKYASTAGLAIGDTIYTLFNKELVPALVIKNMSSTSVVGNTLGTFKFQLNDKIIAKRRIEIKKQIETKPNKVDLVDKADTIASIEKPKLHIKSNVNGRISVSSFSGFSNKTSHQSQIVNYSFSLNVNRISNSNLSFESNVLFRQESGRWSDIQKNIFNGLKIYDLALKYDFSKNSYVSLGRRTNANLSNIGAIDGIQAEKSFKNFYIGGFIGSRPHYLDYSFNFNLIEYGAYLGHNVQNAKWNMQNSVAILEQTNHSKTDRRFLYFQHNSSLLKNLQMFYSLELDMYKVINEKKQNTISMTNTYFSLRYRMFKRLTFSGSYDSRKNVIYYETNKDYISTLLESEARQGYSLQLNINVLKDLNVGAKVGYRFQKSDPTPSQNTYFFISHYNLFNSHISITLSSTMLKTIYLNGNVYNVRIIKGFNSDKLSLGLGYSFVNYKISKAEFPLKQNITEVNLTTQIVRNLFFSLNFESDFENSNQYHRLNLQLRKRF